jgi:hypothetical protein
MENIYQQIYKVHSKFLSFNDIRQDPALVVFSAIPGSGKSEITKRLVAQYGFLRIANKDIRNAIEITGHSDDVIIGEYTLWLLNKITSSMPMSIVFDRNIDQWYEPSRDWAVSRGYRYVVVRIEVTRKALRERLLKREGDSDARVFSVMDFYDEQHKLVANHIKPDLVVEGDYDLDVAAKRIASTSIRLKPEVC